MYTESVNLYNNTLIPLHTFWNFTLGNCTLVCVSMMLCYVILISTYFNKTFNDFRYLSTLIFFHFAALPMPTFDTVFRLDQSATVLDVNSTWNLLSMIQNSSIIANLFAFYIIINLVCFYAIVTDRMLSTKINDLEFSLIILIMFLSSLILISINTTIDLLITLETLTFSAYILIGYNRKNSFSAYAGVQYLILSAIPSAFFLLGLAFLYANWGTVYLGNISALI